MSMQSPLVSQAARKLGIGQRIEQPDHAHRNCGFLNEVGHGIGYRAFFAVETNDKSCGDEHPGGIELVDARREITTGILLLAR